MDADPEVQKREMGIRSARLLKVVPAYAAFVVLLIGGTVLLAGWVGDIRAFREIVQGWASM
jgi:hypothetical protein